jgi:hypothetical protein
MTTNTVSNAIMGSSRLFLILIFVAVFNDISCSQPNVGPVSEQIIQGIPCTGVVKYFENKKLNSCTLSKDFKVDEYLLPAGTKLFFGNDGKLSRCIVSKDTKFNGQLLPAKTNVFLNMWGEQLSFWLPANTLIQGYLIGASDDGQGTPLYSNGRLKEIWLQKDTLVDNVPCTTSANIFKYGWHVISMGTERRLRFYDNGHIQRAMLSRDVTIQAHSYKKGELVFFDKEGKIDLNAKK